MSQVLAKKKTTGKDQDGFLAALNNTFHTSNLPNAEIIAMFEQKTNLHAPRNLPQKSIKCHDDENCSKRQNRSAAINKHNNINIHKTTNTPIGNIVAV